MTTQFSHLRTVPHDSAPLYERVRHQIQMLVLGRPLSDMTPLPPESQLIESLGVSRGTLRRAIEDLVREGLLRTVQGSGTFVNPDERVRQVVWNRLREVARPDSRFDMNLQKFVPDFAERHLADITVQSLDAWENANVVFIAPDNSTEALRLHALAAGKAMLVPTYGLARGFVLLKGNLIKAVDRGLAATLDGMERFGKRLGPADLVEVGHVDVIVTGATAVTMNGQHIGGGQRYLALEINLMRDLDVVDDSVPVIAIVHDCQVIAETVQAKPDCAVEIIVTPTRIIRCGTKSNIRKLKVKK